MLKQLLRQAATGRYVPGLVQQGDCILGYAFGLQGDEPGPVNEALAGFIARLPPYLPAIVQEEIYLAGDLGRAHPELAHPVALMGQRIKSTEVADLQERLMASLDKVPQHLIIVAQAHHAPRVAAIWRKRATSRSCPQTCRLSSTSRRLSGGRGVSGSGQ